MSGPSLAAWWILSDYNQLINVLFRSRSRNQDEFWATNINRSTHFLSYLAGVATICPLNSCRIKRSRASERSDQAIKDDFHRSRFLIPVANASTGEVYVTTPCSRSLMPFLILQADCTRLLDKFEQILWVLRARVPTERINQPIICLHLCFRFLISPFPVPHSMPHFFIWLFLPLKVKIPNRAHHV